MSPNADQLYCSVDLEFTGFDPSRDQILEIGFAFFRLGEGGIEFTEQWSQVFKSSIEVHPKILGLTGITQVELDAAPDFNDHREFLQEKLGDAIIVGHNPVMDVKFLESYGIKLSGKVIDTLELVQFILPTHHSYNLENLVHYFGIKHHKAHRALGDAISTAHVLENLVRIYSLFPAKLKKELSEIAGRGEFLWQGLLAVNLKPKTIEQNDSLHHAINEAGIKPLELNDSLVTIDSNPDNHEARVVLGLKRKNKPAVIVVQDSATVMRLWKEGFVHGVFQPEDTFSNSAFNSFLKKAATTEELRFCLKVIVWLHTNWQSEVVFDLNISFFGGQFRQFIVGGKPKVGNELVLAVDYVTLQNSNLPERELTICDLQSFEKYISTGYGTKLSWSSVLYNLKLIYNPETEFGDAGVKEEVIAALINTDLFFGLVYMLLHQAYPSNQYATVEELDNDQPHILERLHRAALNLNSKLEDIQKKSKAIDLGRTISYLRDFFETSPGRVKWITIDERNLSFSNQPIDISQNVSVVFQKYGKVHFTETITQSSLLSYYVDRLGLHTEMSELPNKTLPENLSVYSSETKIQDYELFKEVLSSPLPLVVVFPDVQSVKNFYNEHYVQIKANAALFAQGYSGGGNKMFRNFSIRENSILLVTADFMAKQNYKIPAQTIIFTSPPGVEKDHPYISALLKHWLEAHDDLVTTFQMAKVVAALKKIKFDKGVVVKMYNFSKKQNFVDNNR